MKCARCNRDMDKAAAWVGAYPIGPKCFERMEGKRLAVHSKVVKIEQHDLFNQEKTMQKTLKAKRLHENAIIPKYQTAQSACFDLHAATVAGASTIGSNVTQGFPVTCGTGLAFDIPENNVMLIFSRSGHGFKHQVRLSNCAGVIDADYTGEVMVQLVCDEPDHDMGHVPFFVRPGDRIAQAMILPVDQWAIEEVTELKETERGAGGFGSTGTQSDLL